MALNHPNNIDARGSTFNDIGHDQTILNNNATINNQTIHLSLFSIQNSSDYPPRRDDGTSRLTSTSKGSPTRPRGADYSSYNAVFLIDAAISLVFQIANMLISYQDRSNDHQELELELEDLRQILYLTKLAIREYDGRPLGQSLANAITPEVHQCRMLMRELLEKITGTWTGLILTKISDIWRKIWQGRWDDDELVVLRKGLSNSRNSLGMFLRALNSVTWMDLGNELTAGHVSLKELRFRLKQHSSSLHHIKINTVQVVDHLGDIILVPTIFCSTWKDFHHIIYSHCKNRIGHHFIKDQVYTLTRTSDNQVIDPLKLADEIEPGTILEMSIVVWQRGAYQRKCPRCGHVNLNVTATESGWIECRECPGKFCVSVMVVNGEAPIGEEIDSSVTHAKGGKTVEQATTAENCNSDGTQFLRRIHLICLPNSVFGMGIVGQSKGPINFDRQCGVIDVRNLPCSQSLACDVHSLDGKRAVRGRSRPYDELWLEWSRAINSRWVEPVQQEAKRESITERRVPH